MRRPSVFDVPPTAPFADALAAGILARWGEDPLALSSVLVLLPTRRACRTLREAFLRQSGGKPLLLPRMAPLGEPDADELVLSGDAALDLPPAVPAMRRRLLLARLVLQWGAGREQGPKTPDQAARLAAELAKLLDETQIERLSLDGLAALAPDDYAEHWRLTLDFLKIAKDFWPRILTDEGVADPAARRVKLVEAQIEAWRRDPPRRPVIAAGSTGSQPATADLLAAAAKLPQGEVVLPGLDREMDDASWEALDESHPQWLLARLLKRLEVPREQVRPWPGAALAAAAPDARAELWREALRPAATVDAWRDAASSPLAARLNDALGGLERIDCAGPNEEATVIALKLREALETPGQTAALVTPDRVLARRVAACLKRWGVELDDSAGAPLAQTPVGAFLRLSALAAAEKAAPAALLAALKHPLTACGFGLGRFRALTRRLETSVLRGPRPGPGCAGLRSAVAASDHAEDLAPLVDAVAAAMSPLEDALSGPPRPPTELIELHLACAEALAASEEESGPERLWRHEDGETAAEFFAELREAAADFPPIDPAHYPAFLDALMAGASVRPRHGLHPRLHVWGLLEARLQRADLMILAGLNEGVWPPEVESDLWLSRPMRKSFGLPAPELRVGQAAHDFVMAACAPRVVLTRALRADGAPTVPSRWLTRLDALLEALGHDGALGEPARWLALAAALDRPDAVRPVAAPAPRPPVQARPRRLSVTEIATWLRDPYAIYARHVLALKPLDPIDADPGAAERGAFVHKALELFVAAHPGELPADARERLLTFGEEAFGAALAQPEAWAFWWPRFVRAVDWFLAHERERRAAIRPAAVEAKGRLVLDAPAGEFTLVGKADRIDRGPDGALIVVDYKTGGVPKKDEVRSGAKPQLTLEAAMLESGGFQDAPAAKVAEIAYWKLGGREGGTVTAIDDGLEELIAEARAGLAALVAAFDDPATPYHPLPRSAPGLYDDYVHLARVAEWKDEA